MRSASEWWLPRRWYAFIVPPMVAFLAANLILISWGGANSEVAPPFAADGHLEAAARLKTLATFLIYAAFALASTFYAVSIAARAGSRDRAPLLAAYVLTLLFGTLAIGAFGLDRGDEYLEVQFPCASLERLHTSPPPEAQQNVLVEAQRTAPSKAQQNAPAKAQRNAGEPPERAAPTASDKAAAGDAGENKAPPRPARIARDELECASTPKAGFAIPAARADGRDGFRHLRLLYMYAAILLCLATPALILGTIACLALPEEGSARERHAAWRRQTEALNRLLYITAAFLIAGLFYASARWNWPAYSLHPDDVAPYTAHVRSLVLYLGVLNSVLIASYYLPVAAALAAREPPRARTDAAGTSTPDESRNPFAAYRTALAILSPAILGLLGQLLKFTP